MNWKERIAEWMRPITGNDGSPALAALDAARRSRLAEDYETALKALDRAWMLAKADDGAFALLVRLRRADVLIEAGRLAEAEDELIAVLGAAPDDARRAAANLGLGRVAAAQGDLAGARAAFERAREYAKHSGSIDLEALAVCQLAGIYWAEGNASYAVHLLREWTPRLNLAEDFDWASPFIGLLAQALFDLGQESEGRHFLGRALQLAELRDDRKHERKWSLALGERAAIEARHHDAEAHYVRALSLFNPAMPTTDYVMALCLHSKNLLALHEAEAALQDARRAVEAASLLGDSALILRARGVLGVALRAVGRGEEAVEHLQAAAEGTQGAAQVDVLRSLAAARLDAGDTTQAIETYQRAIAQAEAADAQLELAQARRDLGLAYMRMGQYAQAVTEWTAALHIYEERKAHAQVARLYCDLGSARKAMGLHARALRDYEQALIALNSVEEYDLETRGLVLSNAGNAYAEQGDAESADSFFSEAITIAERLGDRKAEAIRGGNYGFFLLLVGRPRRAVATLERALQLSQSLGMSLHAAVQMDNLGLAYDGLSDYPEALRWHRQALERIAPLNQPYWQASFQIHTAGTLIALGELDEAQTLFETALTYGRLSETADLIARALNGLALIAIKRGQPADAEGMLAEAINLARRADLRRVLAEALAIRSQQQAALGQFAEAAATWDEAARHYHALHMPQAKLKPAWLKT